MSYSINDFKKGDSVYFRHPNIGNHDLYWEVVGINTRTNSLELKLDEMGLTGHVTMNIQYVITKLSL